MTASERMRLNASDLRKEAEAISEREEHRGRVADSQGRRFEPDPTAETAIAIYRVGAALVEFGADLIESLWGLERIIETRERG